MQPKHSSRTHTACGDDSAVIASASAAASVCRGGDADRYQASGQTRELEFQNTRSVIMSAPLETRTNSLKEGLTDALAHSEKSQNRTLIAHLRVVENDFISGIALSGT